MKLKITLGIILASLLGGNLALPTSALAPAETVATTVAMKEIGNNAALLQLGNNNLLFGETLQDTQQINGLGFFFGNRVELKGQSEYNFIAGNIINYTGKTEKDLFVAGNYINLEKDAKVGRDVFAAGNSVSVATNLPGNFSAGASQVIFRDVKIDGDVSLDVAQAIFEGKVEIIGKLTINSDADISGWSNLTYGEVEKYEAVINEPTVGELLLAQMISIIGLFVVMIIVMLIFPKLDRRVKQDLSAEKFGKNLFAGVCALVAVPFVVIFLLMSYVGAPAGIVLLVTYLVLIYVSLGIAGYYLGKLIFEKGFKQELNRFVEALVGITLLMLAMMIPSLGALIGMIAISLGLGVIVRSLSPKNKIDGQTTKSATKAKAKKGKVVKEA